MGKGKPIIASKIGGLPDIVVNDETGLIIPPNDVKALSEAVNEMISNQVMREKMGIKAMERFLNLFSAEKVVPQIEGVYNDLQ